MTSNLAAELMRDEWAGRKPLRLKRVNPDSSIVVDADLRTNVKKAASRGAIIASVFCYPPGALSYGTSTKVIS